MNFDIPGQLPGLSRRCWWYLPTAAIAGLYAVEVRDGEIQLGLAERELVDVQPVLTTADLECLVEAVDVHNKWMSRGALVAVLQIDPFPDSGAKASRAIDDCRRIGEAGRCEPVHDDPVGSGRISLGAKPVTVEEAVVIEARPIPPARGQRDCISRNRQMVPDT